MAEFYSFPDRHHKPVFIPHFSELNHAGGALILDEAKKKGYRVVLPNEDPLFVAEAVAGSPLVVTSSLHGLVFADAYGIPAQLVSFRAKTEPDLKFHDYSSVFGEVPHFMPVVDALSIPVTGMIDRVESRTRNVAVTLPGVIDGIHGVAAHSLQFLSEDL